MQASLAQAEKRRILSTRWAITSLTLRMNGADDIGVPATNSVMLSHHQVILSPDPGHRALLHYPDLFVVHAKVFVDGVSCDEVLIFVRMQNSARKRLKRLHR